MEATREDRGGSALPFLRWLPNLLSGLRLACAVALPFAPRSWWLVLVLVAGATDWLDGWLARRLRATSWIGGLLDGVGDKAFVVAALVTFEVHGLFEWWQIPFLLLRDLSVASGVLVSTLKRDADAFRHMDSRTFGKLTTVLIFALLVARLQWPEATAVHGVLYSASVIASAAAAVDYYLSRRSRIMGGPAR